MSDLLLRHLTQLLRYSRANFRESRTCVVPRIFLLGKGMNVVPLTLHQSVYVQPGQRSSTTGSSGLQGFEFVQSLVEPS